jgi:hypothetical protein
VARLDLEILMVDCNGFCGHASNVVAVHKDRHGASRRVLFYIALHTAPLDATV